MFAQLPPISLVPLFPGPGCQNVPLRRSTRPALRHRALLIALIQWFENWDRLIQNEPPGGLGGQEFRLGPMSVSGRKMGPGRSGLGHVTTMLGLRGGAVRRPLIPIFGPGSVALNARPNGYFVGRPCAFRQSVQPARFTHSGIQRGVLSVEFRHWW
jgi:hypothetical protein